MSGETQVQVGPRIVRARKEKGLSQRELGLAVGSATRTVQTWEAGQRVPRLNTLKQIADVTGRPVSWFYEPDEQPVAA